MNESELLWLCNYLIVVFLREVFSRSFVHQVLLKLGTVLLGFFLSGPDQVDLISVFYRSSAAAVQDIITKAKNKMLYPFFHPWLSLEGLLKIPGIHINLEPLIFLFLTFFPRVTLIFLCRNCKVTEQTFSEYLVLVLLWPLIYISTL